MSHQSTDSPDDSFEITVWSDSDIRQAEKERALVRMEVPGVARCAKCDGRGVIALLTTEVPCEACLGTGWVDSPDSADVLVIYKETMSF